MLGIDISILLALDGVSWEGIRMMGKILMSVVEIVKSGIGIR